MDIRLLALDIDGTLTNDQKEITKDTFDILMEAQKRGIRLALASARPTPGLYACCDLLNMRRYQGILMAYNGGRIVDAASGKVLFETCMPREETIRILQFLEKLPVTVILDDGQQFYVLDEHGYKVEYECWNNRMQCTQVEDLKAACTFSPVKLLLSVLPEQIHAVQEQIAAFLPETMTVVRTAPFYLEIIPVTINKGQGVREICAALGIPVDAAVAFGDSENDIPMLVEAGCGVAMGNAEEAVKQAADYITASNNEDGIARALRRWL